MQTKGLPAPWQWPGLGPSKKSEKITNQYPTPVIFHSSYPIFHLSCTCLHSGESHCPHFLTTSVTPAVEISLCSRGILQLFQRIARHSSYHIAMKSISLPQSHWWPALCLTGDECITVNSEACLKKNWPSKNLVCSSLPLSGIHPRTQSSNVKEIDFDFFQLLCVAFCLPWRYFEGERFQGHVSPSAWNYFSGLLPIVLQLHNE